MSAKLIVLAMAVALVIPAVCLASEVGDNPPDDLVFQQSGPYGVVYGTFANLSARSVKGSIVISGIPSGAQIIKAYFFVDAAELSQVYEGAGGSFNGTDLPHKGLPDYIDPFVFAGEYYEFQGYMWDVTPLVTGDGTYSFYITGPSYCLSEFLIIVFSDPSLEARMVSITMGEEFLWALGGDLWRDSTVEIPNILAGAGVLHLLGECIGVSGEERLEFNGNAVDVDVFDSLGDFYETNVTTIDGLNTVTLYDKYDMLLWKVVILISPGKEIGPIDKIEAKLDRDLPRIEAKLDELGIGKLEEKLDVALPGITKLERKLDELNLGGIVDDLGYLEEKTDKIGANVEPLGDQLEGIEAKLDRYLGEITLARLEEKLDKIGGQANEGLDYLFQIATAAAIDAIEEKLDSIPPKIDGILYDTSIGLAALHQTVGYLEQKLDYQGDLMWRINFKVEELATTIATVVVSGIDSIEAKLDRLPDSQWYYTLEDELLRRLDSIEAKLDTQEDFFGALEWKLDYLVATFSSIVVGSLDSLERKLDNQPGWDWYTSFEDGVYVNLNRLESKIDQSVNPGIDELIDMVTRLSSGATLAMIEEKLDDLGYSVETIYGMSSDIQQWVMSSYYAVNAVESKLDELGSAVAGLEVKEDNIAGVVHDMFTYVQESLSGAVYSIEAKIDGDVGEALAAIEEKLDALGQYDFSKLDSIYEVVLDTNSEVYGLQTYLMDNVVPPIDQIEAKLDEFQGYQLWQIPTIATLVHEIYYTDLPAIENKIDRSVLGGLDEIETKIDERVIPTLSTLEFKIDQVELKLLDWLLSNQNRCLSPIVFTPVSINPHGKLEEVMYFVEMTLNDLNAMGYETADAWGTFYTGQNAYESGNWLYAGLCFRDAYNIAMAEAGSCPGQ